MQNRHTPRFKPVKILLAMFLVSSSLQHEDPVWQKRKRRVSPPCETAEAGMKETAAAG
ncbi:MAG: hypothetical protein IPG80_04590 [Anaerolineales bacterium]|uniref:hypothetical protein n=1 Tax=Candidatus Villigracilis vicinus TaxID=3140679 RepID=UPI003135797D|nr:hypothetical protein [Anaerolineales bacterium]